MRTAKIGPDLRLPLAGSGKPGKTKRTKVVLQPSPSWEVTWRRQDHNTL